jgi:hypothetical protein
LEAILNDKVLWLRICYWWGIIADAVMAMLMLWPELFLRFMGLRLTPDMGLTYGLRFGAPLMIGWTILLFWASRRPVERKAILLITAYPVVAGYILLNVYGFVTGLAVLAQAIPTLLSQVGLLALSTVSYLWVKDTQP